MTRIRILSALLAAVALAGCEQDAIQIDDITAPATGAWVKFFNFSLGAPQVNFYAGDRKVTAVSSTTATESTVGVAYGGAAAGGVYTAIPAGQVTFAGRISATVDKDLATFARSVAGPQAIPAALPAAAPRVPDGARRRGRERPARKRGGTGEPAKN